MPDLSQSPGYEVLQQLDVKCDELFNKAISFKNNRMMDQT